MFILTREIWLNVWRSRDSQFRIWSWHLIEPVTEGNERFFKYSTTTATQKKNYLCCLGFNNKQQKREIRIVTKSLFSNLSTANPCLKRINKEPLTVHFFSHKQTCFPNKSIKDLRKKKQEKPTSSTLVISGARLAAHWTPLCRQDVSGRR